MQEKGVRENRAIILLALMLAINALTVTAIGSAPYFTPMPPSVITCYQNSTCLYDFNATDDQADPYNFTIDTPPFSNNIDIFTGIMNFTPDNDQVGTYANSWAIVKELDTGNGTFAIITWVIININDPPNITSNYPLEFVNISEKEGAWIGFNVSATDIDIKWGDALNYTWMIDGQINLTLLNYTDNIANYTPDYLSAGIHYITINVTDNQSSAANLTWEVNVTNENRAPILSQNISNISMSEDTPSFNIINLNDYFYDLDIDDYPMQYDAVFIQGNNVTILINETEPNNVSIIPDPDFDGYNIVRFRCYDGYNFTLSNEVRINFTGTNDAPTIQQVQNQTAYADTLYQLQIIASDPDLGTTLIYYDNTTLFNINPSSGFIAMTSPPSNIGNYSIEINVSDGIINTTMIFNLTIINNSAPIIGGTPLPDIYTTQGNLTYIAFNATDIDPGDTIQFHSTSNKTVNPQDFNITMTNSSRLNATGFMQFTPLQADVGDWSVTIYANDTKGAADIESFVIHVLYVEYTPVLTFIPNQRMKVNLTFNLTIYASDENSNMESFGENTSLFDIVQSGDTSNAIGFINFTPTDSDIGPHWVNITINDTSGRYDWQLVLFNVTYNSPPTLQPIPDQNGTEDFLFTYQLNATDPDPQDTPIFYTNTTIFNISNTGLISFIPTTNHTGTHIINITVGDGEFNVSTLMNLTIGSYNDFPFFNPAIEDYYVNRTNYINTTQWNITSILNYTTNMTVWNSSIYEKNYTDILLYASDEEYGTNQFTGNPLIFENLLTFARTFINFTNASNDTIYSGILPVFEISNYDGTTAMVNFTANNSHVGVYYANITVDDTTGRTNTSTIRFEVFNVNDAPIILNYSPNITYYVNMTENSSMMFDVTAIDIDYGDSIRYQWAVNGTNKSGANQSYFNYTTDFSSAGWKNVTVFVLDRSNTSTIINWTVNVSNVNRIGWYGQIRQYNYTHFNAGLTKTNVTILSGDSGVTLFDTGFGYRPSGIFESSVLDTAETNFFHKFTTINWSGNTTPPANVTFGLQFQTRTAEGQTQTSCPATIAAAYNETDTYNTSNSQITSASERCVQYKFMLTTNDSAYTPNINTVNIGYAIADKVQEQNTNRSWVDLDTYFFDPDTDDNKTFTVTSANNTNLTGINISIDGNSHKTFIDTTGSVVGSVYLMFHMDDGYNITDSNVITINVTPKQQDITPIIIPVGGGGSVSNPVPFEVPKYVNTPVSFRLITPQLVTTYANNTIDVPINIFNSNFTMKNLRLKASTLNKDVNIKISRDYFETMQPNQREFLSLTIESYKTYGMYEINMEATADAVSVAEDGTERTSAFTEKAKIFVNSLLKAEDNSSQVNTKMTFAEDLLSNNPECLELNEFLKKARQMLAENRINEADKMMNQVVESCKYLIAPKEAKPQAEAPAKVYGMPTESAFIMITVSIITLIVAMALIIGWAHIRSKRKELMKKE